MTLPIRSEPIRRQVAAFGAEKRPRAFIKDGTKITTRIKEGYATIGGNLGRTYDISSDGQRFLMLKSVGGADQTAAAPKVIVVQNWTEELKRLVPTK